MIPPPQPAPPRTRSQSHRQRSIRDLANKFESALDLEKTLQAIKSQRLLHVFFTVTSARQEDPVYVSELAEEVANPNFVDFDLSALAPASGRNDSRCVITVWGKTTTDTAFKQIACEFVDFAQLKFIGRTRYSIYSNLPHNSLILALTDGYYLLPHTASATSPAAGTGRSNTSDDLLYMNGLYKHQKTHSVAESLNDVPDQYTCSFNSIMKLSNLQECIVDANNTKADASKHISALLHRKPVLFALRKERDQLKYKLQLTRDKLAQEKLRVADLQAKVNAQRAAMQARREAIKTGAAKQRLSRRKSTAVESSISTDKLVITDDRVLAQNQRARIVNDLNDIFPIDSIPGLSFKFTICNVPLPDYSNVRPMGPQISRALVKDFGGPEEDLIAAAYGFAAQLLTLLSYYLGVPLRYPVQPYGSHSFIIDPISAIQGSRTFPLWTRGSFYFRFQYASFLFNKNIEQLMCSQQMVVADLKPTLANLKNLLLVLSTESRKEHV